MSDLLISELLTRCQDGNADAIDLLVKRFEPWAYDLATALLGDTHLAQDAVQAAFIHALAHLNQLREFKAFPGWFRQIIRTECYRIKRQHRESQLVVEDCIANQHTDTPDKRSELRELRELVGNAINKLPDPNRQVVELFYLDELGVTELANKLGIPEGTAKRRLHDARGKLRYLLLGVATPDDAPKNDPKISL